MDVLLKKSLGFDVLCAVMVFLFAMIISILKHLFLNLPLIDVSDFEILNSDSLFPLLVFAPIFEELVFRGVFFKFTNKILFSLAIPLIFVLIFFFFVETNIEFHELFAVGFLFFIGLLCFLYFDLIISFRDKNPIFFIIVTGFLFAYVHVYNYTELNMSSYLGVLPRLIGGFFLGYIAIKYGIFKSMLFHFFHNSLLVVSVFVNKQFYF